MEKAETYLELISECPNCGTSNTVEWMEETDDKYGEWQCEACGKEFKYCHPMNNYGL